VLAELHQLGVEEEVLLHGAVQSLIEPYRRADVEMPPTRPLAELDRQVSLAGRLVLAPPSAESGSWMNRLKGAQTGFASGWMAVRGVRRRRGSGRGFVLSDHADWEGLLQTVRECGARQVLVTHGQGEVLARYLREVEGITADPLAPSRADAGDDDPSEDQEAPGNGALIQPDPAG
jgi:putative mRNA 3-end processing factor